VNKKSLILAIGPVVVLLALMIGAGVAAEGRGEEGDSGIIHACVNSRSGRSADCRS